MSNVAPQLRTCKSGALFTRTRPRPRFNWFRPRLEWLESRVMPSAGDSIANAIGLSFTNLSAVYQTAQKTEYLAKPSGVVLNRISLVAGDMVTASVNTSPYGGGLNS